MALMTLTADEVETHLYDAELTACSWSDEFVASVIVNQCDRVASVIAASPSSVPRLILGKATIPQECKACVIALCRYTMLAQLPGEQTTKELLGSTRQAEFDAALAFLDAIASGEVLLSYDAVDGLTEAYTGFYSGGTRLNDWRGL